MGLEFLKTITSKQVFIIVIISFVILFLRTCSIDEGRSVRNILHQQDSIFIKIQNIEITQKQIVTKIDKLGLETEANLIQYFLYQNELGKNNDEILQLKAKLRTLKEFEKERLKREKEQKDNEE
jgi:hypothetical protein